MNLNINRVVFIPLQCKMEGLPAGGARFFKSIGQRELLSILSDDSLSLHSEMLIIKVQTGTACIMPVLLLHVHTCASNSSCRRAGDPTATPARMHHVQHGAAV